MKILVTGGDGMLAKAIRNILHNGLSELVFCNKADLDITDADALLKYCTHNNFDVIINCAAYTNVEGAESNMEAAYAINATGTRNIAVAAKATNAYLIHISTDAVYDGMKNDIYREEDVCNPLSIYSKSKYAGELEMLKHHDSGIIIRTSWLYSLDKSNFVTAIVNKAKATGSLNVVYDQLGSPTYTYDLAKAIMNIILSDNVMLHSGVKIYHYSNEGAISWYDFAVNICNILHMNAHITPITSAEYPSKVIRPFQAILSKDKIKTDFGLIIPYWRDSLIACLSSISE